MSAQDLSGRISIAVMVVTLPVVLDRFHDHRENKQAEQRGDDDEINQAPHRRDVSGLALSPLSLCASGMIVT